MSNSEGATGVNDRTVYWIGNEDEQFAERVKACKARRKEYGQASCFEKDGSCDECEHDMAVALRVTKAQFDAHMKDASHD